MQHSCCSRGVGTPIVTWHGFGVPVRYIVGVCLRAVRLPMALPTSIPGGRCLLQATCMDEAGVFGVLNFGESRDCTPSSTVCSLALLRFENSPGKRNLSSPRLFINAIITTLSIRVHHQLRLGLCVRRHQGGQRIAQLSV
jgi:hypothetical protein